jgi:hypothetical protein
MDSFERPHFAQAKGDGHALYHIPDGHLPEVPQAKDASHFRLASV